MIADPATYSRVLWQISADDIIPEPAILIDGYRNTINLSQNGNEILINYESLEELIKTMRMLKKQAQQ